MESAFNDTLIANVTTGTASAVSRYVYYKDSAGVRIDSTGEMAGYQAQNLSFAQHYDADGVSYLGSSKAILWPDKSDFHGVAPFPLPSDLYIGASGNGVFVTFAGQTGTRINDAAVTTDGRVWLQSEIPSGVTDFAWVFAAAFGAGLFVAVGSGGKIYTSPDGIRWTSRTSTPPASFWGVVAFVNGLFIVGGNTGEISTSPDGIAWTSRTSAISGSSIAGFTYGAGLYVAYAFDGKIATSPDGITWTARTSGFGTDKIATAIFAGGQFVIAGGSAKISTSPDGITWTLHTSGLPTTTAISGVAYGNGVYTVLGDGIASSPTGATWTMRTTSIQGTGFVGNTPLLFFKGLHVAAGLSGKIFTSSDGVTWTPRSNPYGVTWFQIMESEGSLIAIGGTGKRVYSVDGLTWSAPYSLGNVLIQSTGYGMNLYLVADVNGNLAISSDGHTWSSGGVPLGAPNYITGFATNGSLIVAVGLGGKISTSTNGTTWTARTSTFGTDAIRGVVWSGSLFVAVGDNGKLATSPDGVTWTARTSSFGTTKINGVTYGAALFVAVGNSGKIATSSDGTTWTQRTGTFATDNIYSVVYGDKFAAVGGTTSVSTSPDGITWTARTNTTNVSNICFGNGQYLIVGSDGAGNGQFATSSDAIIWANNTHYAMPDTIQYGSFGGGVFLLGTGDGRVALSADGAFAAGHTVNGAILAASDGGQGVVITSQPSVGIAYLAATRAPRVMPNGVKIKFSSTGNIVGPVLSDRIVRSLAAGTVSNDLMTAGALSCGLLTSYTSPSVYTEVSTATHPDYTRKTNNLAAGIGHKLTLAQTMNFAFSQASMEMDITHLAVFLTSSGTLAWVVPLPTPIPSGSSVAGYSIVAGAFTLDFADAATVGP